MLPQLRTNSSDTGKAGPELRVVAIGGGTGLSTLLKGLKRYVMTLALATSGQPTIGELCGVVTVSDDGGSSGRLRKEFNLYANLRPVKLPAALAHVCPLRPERQGKGIDILVVRELTAGLYFGKPKKTEEVIEAQAGPHPPRRFHRAVDTMVTTTPEIERIAHVAFRAAQTRRHKVTSIDKANVLENGVLWRDVVTQIGKKYPEIALQHMFVDNGAMQLLLRPDQFDVLLCENTFGDILSDEASMLTGSLGMLASASLGDGTALYEPSHGSAPDIAGLGVANPLAMLLSVEMMLRHSFAMDAAADRLAKAIASVLDDGWRTRDIASADTPADRVVGTSAMGDLVAERL